MNTITRMEATVTGFLDQYRRVGYSESGMHVWRAIDLVDASKWRVIYVPPTTEHLGFDPRTWGSGDRLDRADEQGHSVLRCNETAA